MSTLPKEKTNKFLEITDPKKAVGLWSHRVVRETAMTPVGATREALGRFLNGDVVRWEHREKMCATLCEKGVGVKRGTSPARAIGECLAEADADKKRLTVAEWRERYAWLLAWSRYASRLAAPRTVAAEPDVQMFFDAPSAGLTCHEGNLHSGRVFFLRREVEKVGGGGQRKFNYFVCVVLKPGGTKWWWSLERVNVTWTTNTYDRLIIDPRGKLEWSPMDAEVLTEQVTEKNVCLFMLEDDALFRAITDNELNPNEKYARLCTAFDFFCRQGSAECGVRSAEKNSAHGTQHLAPTFYLRWSAFFNPRRGKFELAERSKPRVIEVMGERKKGWIARPLAVREVGSGDGNRASGNGGWLKYGNARRKTAGMDREAAKVIRTSDAKLGLGDTPLDRYAQEVARRVAESNGCAVLPVGASRELRIALAHALFFVTFPDRKPNEPGGILRGYQLPGRLVEHASGNVRAEVSEKLKARIRKDSEDALARRRKAVVDCLFTRACSAVLLRNRDVLDEKGVVQRMNAINARAVLEKAAWQRGFMEGNPLLLFKPSPTAGNLKLPDLSLALAFERLLGLKGETAGSPEVLVQTAPIRTLEDERRPIRGSVSGAYACRAVWKPRPGKEDDAIAYPADSVRILRDESRYYLMAIPKYALYQYERDLAFRQECEVRSAKHGVGGAKIPVLRNKSVPVYAYSFKSVGGVRSRADSYVVEEIFDINKVMQLARDGRLLLYSIDFGRDKWLADIVFSKENRRPCKIVPSIPLLSSPGGDKRESIDPDRRSGTDVRTKIPAGTETLSAHITFTFNPTVSRDGRKVEGRSWKSYLDAFPAENRREVERWNGGEVELADALQKVIESDGVLLTDKEHLEEALRAATYVVPSATNNQQPTTNNYQGYNLKDRIFKDSDGRAEWRERVRSAECEVRSEGDRKKKAELNAKYEAQRKEQKGKPLCEVLGPDLAKEAEVEFTRQIEADTLVDAKTSKSFSLDEPIKVTDDFKEAVAREFRRIAYTGTMGWRRQLNRPSHEVAIGVWLAGLFSHG